MFYQVLYFDKSGTSRVGTGVYAPNETQARAVGAYVIGLANGITVNPDSLTLVEVDSLESDIPTTT